MFSRGSADGFGFKVEGVCGMMSGGRGCIEDLISST